MFEEGESTMTADVSVEEPISGELSSREGLGGGASKVTGSGLISGTMTLCEGNK
jgi:hypothetical protein